MTSSEDSTVFVIDDDEAVRASIEGLLKSVGLQSESFGTAHEFLLSKRPDGPSCLVLDVRLPGISGLDFQHELAEAGVEIPIIFITGHGDIPMTVKAMKSGAVEFLTKPPFRLTCWKANFLAMKGALLPAQSRKGSVGSKWPTKERCFWMRLEIFRQHCSQNCCAYCRNRSSSAWAVLILDTWTFGWWLRRIVT